MSLPSNSGNLEANTPPFYIHDNNGKVTRVDEETARAMFHHGEATTKHLNLPPTKTLAEMKVEYATHLAKEGKVYYETSHDTILAGEVGSDFTLVTNRKERRKKKIHVPSLERKTRSLTTEAELVPTQDKPEFKGRKRKPQHEEGNQTKGPQPIYTADEEPDLGVHTP